MLLSSVSPLFLLQLLRFASAAVLKPLDAAEELPNTYIVRFRDGLTNDVRSNHTDWVRSLEKTETDGTIIRSLRHKFNIVFDGYSAVLDDETVKKVGKLDFIDTVTPVGLSTPQRLYSEYETIDEVVDANVRTTADDVSLATIQTDKDKGWNANRLSHRQFTQSSYANGPWVHDGYLGQGVTVYILDSGVKIENPGFQGSEVVHGKSMVTGSPPTDNNGHGTMCAGVIAGNAHGLSPKAKLVNVKVANDQDRSSCDSVVAGLEWVVAQPGENNMKVISMSQTGFTGRPDVSQAVAAVVKKGVHVVVCAGNYDVDACGVEPSNAPGAVVVGSIEPNGKFPTKSSSPEGTNVGKCVTIFGPGSRVPTLSHKNLSPSYKYFAWGTSIAAPQVAALIANRLSKVGAQTPAAITKWLQDTATKDQIQGNLRGSPNLIAFSGVGEGGAAKPGAA